MCHNSLRSILWRAAFAALGTLALAICIHLAPASHATAASRTLAQHVSSSDNRVTVVLSPTAF
jgi:hypothetical protein